MKNFNLRNLSYKTFLLIFGLFWTCTHLYFRLLIDRPTQLNLNDIQASTLTWIILFSYFIILHILLLGVALKTVFFKHKTNFILQRIIILINTIYWEPLKYIENLIIPYIPGSGRFYIFLESKLQTYQHNTRFKKALIFFIHFLPQIVIASIFCVEIIFFNNLRFFFPSLLLLLFPLASSIFLHIYITFADRNITLIHSVFEYIIGHDPICDSKGNPILNYDGTYAAYGSIESKLYKDEIGKVNSSVTIQLLVQLIRIHYFGNHLKILIASYYPYCTLLTSSLYLMGGIYRLSYLFIKIFEMISTLPI